MAQPAAALPAPFRLPLEFSPRSSARDGIDRIIRAFGRRVKCGKGAGTAKGRQAGGTIRAMPPERAVQAVF